MEEDVYDSMSMEELIDTSNNSSIPYNEKSVLIKPTKSYSVSLDNMQENHLITLSVGDENYIIG